MTAGSMTLDLIGLPLHPTRPNPPSIHRPKLRACESSHQHDTLHCGITHPLSGDGRGGNPQPPLSTLVPRAATHVHSDRRELTGTDWHQSHCLRPTLIPRSRIFVLPCAP